MMFLLANKIKMIGIAILVLLFLPFFLLSFFLTNYYYY